MQRTSQHQLWFTRRRRLLQSWNANQLSHHPFIESQKDFCGNHAKILKKKIWFFCENLGTCEDNQNYVVDIGSLGWSISSSKWSIGRAGGQLTQVSILAMSYVLSDTSVLLMMILGIIFSKCEQLTWLTINTLVNTRGVIRLIRHQHKQHGYPW